MTSETSNIASTWTQSLFDSITDESSSLQDTTYIEPVHKPTRTELDEVHAGWFLEDLGEFLEVYAEIGSPISLDLEFLVVGTLKVIWPNGGYAPLPSH